MASPWRVTFEEISRGQKLVHHWLFCHY